MCIFSCSNTFAQKIRASGLFCQMDKFSGIPPKIGVDWVLYQYNCLGFCRKNMLIKFGFHMGTLLYGIVFLSIRLNTLIR